MDAQVIDISSSGEFPAGDLSNFTARRFCFRGVQCASLEGILQALKFEDPEEQIRVCGLIGIEAKRAGRKRNKVWQAIQTLWWQRERFDRESEAFQLFLDEIFESVFTDDPTFREALLATGDAQLIHSIGNSDPTKTVLTEDEFCSRLLRLRETLRSTDK